MVVAQDTESSELMDQGPLFLTRNLIWIAINNIIYVRGLFHEKYFSDKSIKNLEMKIKRLMPMNAESRRLINLLETGVYDSLEKGYLKTLLFCICEEEGPMIEEYAFSFSYPKNSTGEVVMNISSTGSKKATFTSTASEVTPGHMRISACKMIRTLVSLMRTLDPMPEKMTLVMKLLYYDNVTPGDYEPPFFKCCADNEGITLSNKNLLKMEVGDFYSNELVLSLKSVLDPSNKNIDVNSMDDDLSEAEILAYEEDCHIMPPNDDQHTAYEKVIGAQVKTSTYTSGTRIINVLDDLSIFPEISLAHKMNSGFLLVSSSKKIEFLLDSGATHHVCNDKSIMRNLEAVKEEDQVSLFCADGTVLKAEMMGSVITKDIELGQVSYIPNMTFNVVSIGQLAAQGLLTNIADGRFSIIEPGNARLVGGGYLQHKKEKASDEAYHEYILRTMKWNSTNDVKLNPTSEDNYDSESLKEKEVSWAIDTGCAKHMVSKLCALNKAKHNERSFRSGSGTITSTHTGTAKVGQLLLHDVFRIPGIPENLISGPMLDTTGHRMIFYADKCTIIHKEGLALKGVGILDTKTRLYWLDANENNAQPVAKGKKRNQNRGKEREAKRAKKT